jgi:hypothetical protein
VLRGTAFGLKDAILYSILITFMSGTRYKYVCEFWNLFETLRKQQTSDPSPDNEDMEISRSFGVIGAGVHIDDFMNTIQRAQG